MASVVGSLSTVSSLLSDSHRSLPDVRFAICGGSLPEATLEGDFLQPAVGQKRLFLFYVTSQACSLWVAVDAHRSV